LTNAKVLREFLSFPTVVTKFYDISKCTFAFGGHSLRLLRKDKKADSTLLSVLQCTTQKCNDFEFFEKMEKNIADMDVTCKFNTYLEKAFSPFF
jgi:hypothetical protein